ncbi:MAG: hypothetical protein IT495_10490 [Gammaproteobacteria bacterium]|nr:hypothetical protein [Gammaproteobacteria bacterium]
MATKSGKATAVNAPSSILELELALLREKLARDDWNLAAAANELTLMQTIRDRTGWPAGYKALLQALDESLVESLQTVKNKDTTRIQAAHTRLERAVYALRDHLYR